MIKVAVIAGSAGATDKLNDYDVTGGNIQYYDIYDNKLKGNRILWMIRNMAMFIINIRKFDALLLIYVCKAHYIYAYIAKVFGVPTIAHWIGTDVYKLLHSKRKYPGLHKYTIHLACSNELQEELATKGVSAKVLIIEPGHISIDIAKMPELHAVCIYMPNGRELFYGYDILSKVINKYPQVDFYIVANNNSDLFPQPNAKMLGWISREEMDSLYNKISIVIRCVAHDGWSQIVTEGLFKGKEIIYNFSKIPYTRKAATFEQICKEMDDILLNPPTPCRDAHEYALKNHKPQMYSERMANEIRELLNV